MARRVSVAQYNRMVRQAHAKQRRAVGEYNRKARQHNAKVKRELTQFEQGVNNYNREVRVHNARVQTNRRRLASEIQRLERQQGAARVQATRSSSLGLYTAFQQVEAEASHWGAETSEFVDLAEADAVNSAAAANALGSGVSPADATLDNTLGEDLRKVSGDLDRRWRGALFALNPENPDAARHFCTSAREIVTQLIDQNAPDEVVLQAFPDCERTRGRPIRRARINFLLSRHQLGQHSFGQFVDKDVADVLALFDTFNAGTHGEAGQFDLPALLALKERVEGGVRFLSRIVTPAP